MPDDLLAHKPEANAAPVKSPAPNAPTLGRIAVRVTVWTSLGNLFDSNHRIRGDAGHNPPTRSERIRHVRIGDLLVLRCSICVPRRASTIQPFGRPRATALLLGTYLGTRCPAGSRLASPEHCHRLDPTVAESDAAVAQLHSPHDRLHHRVDAGRWYWRDCQPAQA